MAESALPQCLPQCPGAYLMLHLDFWGRKNSHRRHTHTVAGAVMALGDLVAWLTSVVAGPSVHR